MRIAMSMSMMNIKTRKINGHRTVDMRFFRCFVTFVGGFVNSFPHLCLVLRQPHGRHRVVDLQGHLNQATSGATIFGIGPVPTARRDLDRPQTGLDVGMT